MPLSETDINLDQAKLPDTLRDLLQLIGLAATVRLLERRGGCSLHVPGRMHSTHHLVMLLGEDTAHKLSTRYSKDRIILPKLDTLLRAARDQEIKKRRMNGESPKVLAEEYWLTDRQIRNICCEHI